VRIEELQTVEERDYRQVVDTSDRDAFVLSRVASHATTLARCHGDSPTTASLLGLRFGLDLGVDRERADDDTPRPT
jgi:hypothetical protein